MTILPPEARFAVTRTRTSAVAAPFTVLSVAGDLDLVTAPRLQKAIDAVTAEASPRIVLDLHAVTFCDCRGLAIFATAHVRCTARGGWLALASPPPQLVQILTLTGLMEHVPVYPTLMIASDMVSRQTDRRRLVSMSRDGNMHW